MDILVAQIMGEMVAKPFIDQEFQSDYVKSYK